MVKETKSPLCFQPGVSNYTQVWGHVPRCEGIKACAQATWWNFHYLIFDLVFWYSVPTTFEHKGMIDRLIDFLFLYECLHLSMSACTLAWVQA